MKETTPPDTDGLCGRCEGTGMVTSTDGVRECRRCDGEGNVNKELSPDEVERIRWRALTDKQKESEANGWWI